MTCTRFVLLLALSGCSASWVALDRVAPGETGDDTGGPAADVDGDGFTVAQGDCDDADPTVNPGADEVCDPADVDEDCDGLADDADGGVTGQTLTYLDADRDGWGDPLDRGAWWCDPPPDRAAPATGDCDDDDPSVNPAAADPTDGTGRDEDCDGFVDEDGLVPGALLFTELYWRGGDTSTNYVPDDPWQWIELANRAPARVFLGGFTLVLCKIDGSSLDHAPTAADCQPAETTRVTLPAAAQVAAGDRLVACTDDADLACSATWTPAGDAMSFRNGWVALLAEGVTLGPAATTPPVDLRLDAVGYYYRDGTDYWPSAASKSMRLDDDALTTPGETVNDTYGTPAEGGPSFTTWCAADAADAYTLHGTPRYGTPGAPNGSCP